MRMRMRKCLGSVLVVVAMLNLGLTAGQTPARVDDTVRLLRVEGWRVEYGRKPVERPHPTPPRGDTVQV